MPVRTATSTLAVPSDTGATAALHDDIGDAALASPAAKAASEIEAAYSEVVAAATSSLSADPLNKSSTSSYQCNDSCATSAGASPWWTASRFEAVEEARASFLTKVADAFSLKSAADARGVVYVHHGNSWGGAKLLVDRQLLLRLRGEQQKGSWSLHFLGTGAMQASVSFVAPAGGDCIAAAVPFGALVRAAASYL